MYTFARSQLFHFWANIGYSQSIERMTAFLDASLPHGTLISPHQLLSPEPSLREVENEEMSPFEQEVQI